jgi:hypothetical protein
MTVGCSRFRNRIATRFNHGYSPQHANQRPEFSHHLPMQGMGGNRTEKCLKVICL